MKERFRDDTTSFGRAPGPLAPPYSLEDMAQKLAFAGFTGTFAENYDSRSTITGMRIPIGA